MVINEGLFQKRCKQRDLKCVNGKWFCHYELAKNELPSSVYGDAQPIYIEESYRKHTC